MSLTHMPHIIIFLSSLLTASFNGLSLITPYNTTIMNYLKPLYFQSGLHDDRHFSPGRLQYICFGLFLSPPCIEIVSGAQFALRLSEKMSKSLHSHIVLGRNYILKNQETLYSQKLNNLPTYSISIPNATCLP